MEDALQDADDFQLTMERPASLAEVAADQLRQAILSGRLPQGARLVETDVSQRFGISRSTLRQALHNLSREGLIEIQKNRGSYVANPRCEDIEHMSLLRSVIEGTAARLVTARRQADSIARLVEIVDRQRQAMDAADRDECIRLHWAFHEGICRESGNPFIEQSWIVLGNTIRLYYRLVMNARNAVRDNLHFVEQFREGTPEAAEELVRGQLLKRAYFNLNKPIPTSVLPYIRRHIDDQGCIVIGTPGAGPSE